MISGGSNADYIIGKLNAQINRLSHLQTPLQQAGGVVRDAAVMRIKEQGGDQAWIPNKRGGHTGIDSGRMMNSIQVSPPSATSVTIGTDVRYARWFQEGTGIYAGHRPWTIVPTRKKALAFTIGGVTYVRRSVTIPGQPPRPFLLVGDTERKEIMEVFQHWLSAEAA